MHTMPGSVVFVVALVVVDVAAVVAIVVVVVVALVVGGRVGGGGAGGVVDVGCGVVDAVADAVGASSSRAHTIAVAHEPLSFSVCGISTVWTSHHFSSLPKWYSIAVHAGFARHSSSQSSRFAVIFSSAVRLPSSWLTVRQQPGVSTKILSSRDRCAAHGGGRSARVRARASAAGSRRLARAGPGRRDRMTAPAVGKAAQASEAEPPLRARQEMCEA